MWAAVTKYHRSDRFSVSKSPHPDSEMAVFSLCLHVVKAVRELSGVSSTRALVPFLRALPSLADHFPKVPTSNIITLTARIPTYSFEGDISAPSIIRGLRNTVDKGSCLEHRAEQEKDKECIQGKEAQDQLMEDIPSESLHPTPISKARLLFPSMSHGQFL